MTYLDTTYCAVSVHCAAKDCARRLTEHEQACIPPWQPVAWADFSKTCDRYKEVDKK